MKPAPKVQARDEHRDSMSSPGGSGQRMLRSTFYAVASIVCDTAVKSADARKINELLRPDLGHQRV